MAMEGESKTSARRAFSLRIAGAGKGPHFGWLKFPKSQAQGPRTIRARVFIAGTGRSGTTRLAQVLGSHPEVFAWPFETRFLIDPDGLADLVHWLHERFDYFHANAAIHRFRDLMFCSILKPMLRVLPEEQYRETVEEFLDQLIACTFEEPAGKKVFFRYVARYFEDRKELIALMRRLVDRLFSLAAWQNGKSVWCEKTPFNLLAIPFLWELFPEARIVHIKRDPRGVVESLLRQPWAPSDLEGVLAFIEPVYRRWLQTKQQHAIEQNANYREIALEQVAQDPQGTLDELTAWLGIAPTDWSGTFEPRQVNRWQTQLDAQARRRCEERLGRYIEAMGYPL